MGADAGAPRVTARLFVAVWPPPEVVSLVRSAVPRPDAPGVPDVPGAPGAPVVPGVPGVRWTSPEQWHVTLRFLGSVADPAAVVAAFEAVALPVGAPVVAEVGPAVGRFGRRVLHVPVSGLEGLAAAFAGLPSPDAGRPFSGHLTLARARDRRGVDLRPFAGAPVSASFVVGEVTLVRSHLGGGAPSRYEVVARRVLASNTRL